MCIVVFTVPEQLCGILLDEMSIDNIITLFCSHKFVTDNDLEVISCSPSEYLKRQSLLRCLRYLKLVLWLKICDTVDEHIGGQLREGTYIHVYVCISNSVVYVYMYIMYVHT